MEKGQLTAFTSLKLIINSIKNNEFISNSYVLDKENFEAAEEYVDDSDEDEDHQEADNIQVKQRWTILSDDTENIPNQFWNPKIVEAKPSLAKQSQDKVQNFNGKVPKILRS